MKVELSRSNARGYVSSLAANGRYHFTSGDVQNALAVSAGAARSALSRLERQGVIASPARGFYVVVPPEYRSIGCLPADQFIPELMRRKGLSYYVGLLSASQYYGAAHHRPQEFQVFVGKDRRPSRPIKCGSVRVAFMVRKRIAEVPVKDFNTLRGTILVSTPEATALDLVGYPNHAGGLSQIATVLTELSEQLDPQLLETVAATAPVAWSQRLGYLLETVGRGEKTPPLRRYVRKHARRSAPLLPNQPHEGVERDPRWKLYINTEVVVELLV